MCLIVPDICIQGEWVRTVCALEIRCNISFHIPRGNPVLPQNQCGCRRKLHAIPLFGNGQKVFYPVQCGIRKPCTIHFQTVGTPQSFFRINDVINHTAHQPISVCISTGVCRGTHRRKVAVKICILRDSIRNFTDDLAAGASAVSPVDKIRIGDFRFKFPDGSTPLRLIAVIVHPVHTLRLPVKERYVLQRNCVDALQGVYRCIHVHFPLFDLCGIQAQHICIGGKQYIGKLRIPVLFHGGIGRRIYHIIAALVTNCHGLRSAIDTDLRIKIPSRLIFQKNCLFLHIISGNSF